MARFLKKMKFDFRKTLAGFFINFLHNFFYGRKVCRKNVHSGVNGLMRLTECNVTVLKLMQVTTLSIAEDRILVQ